MDNKQEIDDLKRALAANGFNDAWIRDVQIIENTKVRFTVTLNKYTYLIFKGVDGKPKVAADVMAEQKNIYSSIVSQPEDNETRVIILATGVGYEMAKSYMGTLVAGQKVNIVYDTPLKGQECFGYEAAY
ncbi:hypothetical protein SPFM6_00289 [Salmonella phage SPFM6]|nr:hypothetical protein SPFM6_00289 [Salmonella phage SPFM6]